MSRLDRYLVREVLGPLGLGFVVFTFIMLMQTLFRLAEMIIRRGVPAGQVGQLLLLSLPHIVVLTIPMAFLFGILVAAGRLNADSELIALRAAGLSLYRLYRPVLAISVVLALVNAFLMVVVLPRGNSALQRLQLEIFTRSVAQQVQPRVFYEGWEGLVLYVFDQKPGDEEWRGVFLADSVPAVENEVTVAQSGRVVLSEDGERLILRLADATSHEVDFDEADRYRRVHYRTLNRLLDDQFTSGQRAMVLASKSVRELNIAELREQIADPNLPRQLRNLSKVEIYKKFSIPFAAVVFGLLGLPLGFTARVRGAGRSSGFALSIGVLLVYWVLIGNGEETARIGRMQPWLAMWLPNLLLGGLGLLLLWRANANRSLVPAFIGSWWRHHVTTRWGRRPRRRRGPRRSARKGDEDAPRRPSFVLRLPRFRLQFPNLLDRYVLRTFFWVFVLVTLSAIAVYLIGDFTEKSDEMLENEVARAVVIDYYKYLLLQVYYELAPITVLLTTLIAFALLSRSNEVLAVKASGVSLYRLALPAAVAAAVVVSSCAFLQATVLPASNEKVAEIKDQIKGRAGARTRRADRQWLFGQGRYVYNYLRYDAESEALQRLQVFEFDEQYRLTRRLFAQSARYVDGFWVASGTWVRVFDEGGDRYQRFPEPVVLDFPEKPAYFESELKVPTAMTYGELKRYIQEIRDSGQTAPDLEVELAKKVSFPSVSLIMALVALPFSFRLGRRGALYGIGLAVVLGIVFFGLLALFTTLGETAALPPTVAVWTPNVLFALLSLYLFLGVRS